jgi:hypothetical protein
MNAGRMKGGQPHATAYLHGAGGTAAVGAICQDGDGVMALSQAHRGLVTAIRASFRGSRKDTGTFGAGVFQDSSYLIHNEELRGRRDLWADMEKALEGSGGLEKNSWR